MNSYFQASRCRNNMYIRKCGGHCGAVHFHPVKTIVFPVVLTLCTVDMGFRFYCYETAHKLIRKFYLELA